MSSFTVAGVGTSTFTCTEGGFARKSGLLREWAATLILADSTAWGALDVLVTPKELVSARACRGAPGTPPTISVDIGGGYGVGVLTIDDLLPVGTKNAVLIELTSEAPIIADGQCVAKALWQLTS